MLNKEKETKIIGDINRGFSKTNITDERTTEWVKRMQEFYPGDSVIYSARQCPDCGLYYKPGLGHVCPAVKIEE